MGLTVCLFARWLGWLASRWLGWLARLVGSDQLSNENMNCISNIEYILPFMNSRSMPSILHSSKVLRSFKMVSRFPLARIKSFKSSLISVCLSVAIFVALGYLNIFLLLNLS